MAKRRFALSQYQLQYRRSSTLNKVVVAAAIVLSSLTLISLRLAHWEAEEKLANLRTQTAALDQRIDTLRRDIDALGTTDSVRRIAQEKLGLVDPDTIIFEQAD